MSNTRNAVLGAIAVATTFGAVQLAFGHDLANGIKAFAGGPVGGVNRTDKADRSAVVTVPTAPTQTISIHVDRLADTSVLVRIPRQQEARISAKSSSAKSPANSSTGRRAPVPMIQTEERKATVACEPMVSVLTDIAKRLQPGRCVT